MQSIHHSVSQSDNVIKLLDKKSQQIGSILEAIQNIAEQTNLLALNAAIEALELGNRGEDLQLLPMKLESWRSNHPNLQWKLEV